jgi:hypothetical protein
MYNIPRKTDIMSLIPVIVVSDCAAFGTNLKIANSQPAKS